MLGLVGIIAVITVFGLSLLITRLATVALTLTGLSEEEAKFQARSAFTGIGFTTSEAEDVVNHPARRKVITLLMLLRSAGLITVVLSLILSFTGEQDIDKLTRLAWLAGGVAALWVLLTNPWSDRHLKTLMERVLGQFTNLEVRDYASLLQLPEEYELHELQVRDCDWLCEKTLEDSLLEEEGVTVLGIYRTDGSYVGVPDGQTKIHEEDRLVLYGRAEVLKELDDREKGDEGDRAHKEAVDKEKRRKSGQRKEEEQYEAERRNGDSS